MPKTIDTTGKVESMQQSPKTKMYIRIGLQKIVACSQPYLRCLLLQILEWSHFYTCFTSFFMWLDYSKHIKCARAKITYRAPAYALSHMVLFDE